MQLIRIEQKYCLAEILLKVLETLRFEFHDFYKKKLTMQIKFRQRDRNTALSHVGKHRKNLIENIVFTGVSRAKQISFECHVFLVLTVLVKHLKTFWKTNCSQKFFEHSKIVGKCELCKCLPCVDRKQIQLENLR